MRLLLLALLPATALARDLTLTQQVRLFGPSGEPLGGALPVTVALHGHESADDLLWRAELSPTFTDGYATLNLDLGEGARRSTARGSRSRCGST
jgi:hypothetical protein